MLKGETKKYDDKITTPPSSSNKRALIVSYYLTLSKTTTYRLTRKTEAITSREKQNKGDKPSSNFDLFDKQPFIERLVEKSAKIPEVSMEISEVQN